MPPLQETALRKDGGVASTPVPSLWKTDPAEAIGGAGLYGTANDYIKLLSCLLQGGAPLLKTSSVDELFKPQLGEASRQSFRAFQLNSGGFRLFTESADESAKEQLMPISHSLVGQMNLEDVPGRRKKNSVAWGGLPNLGWWIDREGGVAGTMFSQIYPSGDPTMRELMVELEGATYRLKDGKKA
jgi:CubicO group peptidase (beta-lactamase class C family)